MYTVLRVFSLFRILVMPIAWPSVLSCGFFIRPHLPTKNCFNYQTETGASDVWPCLHSSINGVFPQIFELGNIWPKRKLQIQLVKLSFFETSSQLCTGLLVSVFLIQQWSWLLAATPQNVPVLVRHTSDVALDVFQPELSSHNCCIQTQHSKLSVTHEICFDFSFNGFLQKKNLQVALSPFCWTMALWPRWCRRCG